MQQQEPWELLSCKVMPVSLQPRGPHARPGDCNKLEECMPSLKRGSRSSAPPNCSYSEMWAASGKEPANAGDTRDLGSIPGSGSPAGEGHGNPLQYSCLEDPMDREAGQATRGEGSGKREGETGNPRWAVAPLLPGSLQVMQRISRMTEPTSRMERPVMNADTHRGVWSVAGGWYE